MLDEILGHNEARAAIAAHPLEEPGSYWAHGFRVRQLAPLPDGVKATLAVGAGLHIQAAAIVGRFSHRTRMFVNLLAPDPPASSGWTVRLHTDALYNPYAAYANCLVALAPMLLDAVFCVIDTQEDDDGRWRFVADRYELREGTLSLRRVHSVWGVGESDVLGDENRFMRALTAHFAEGSK